jgi:hypothetical protein
MRFSVKIGLWADAILLLATPPVLMSQVTHPPVLRSRTYNSPFPQAAGLGESFNGIGVANGGTIYLCDRLEHV